MSKFLVAGLGNIGLEYEDTRHNIGFRVAEALAKDLQASFTNEKLASVCEATYKGKKIVIIKPNTYMNLSGKAVNYWMQQEKISPSSIMIATDDLALPYGTLRIKKKGSDGGHNGLTDIIQTLNSTEFPRLRFGIGNEFSRGKQVDYVLGQWTEEENKTLQQRIEVCVEMIKSFVFIGIDRTMSAFNNK